MRRLLLASSIVVMATALLFFIAFAAPVVNGQDTCPDGGGWTKIDSDDLSLYPVDGATEYCFKAGSDNSRGCDGGLFDSWPQPEGTCGLSHWSYFIPEAEDTATPEPTSTFTPTPSSTPTDPDDPTATFTSTPTDTPTSTPTDPEDLTATPTSTPTEGPTPTQTPQETLPPTGYAGVEVDDVAWEIRPGTWAVHASVPGGYTLALWERGSVYAFEGMRVQVLGQMLVNPTDTWVLSLYEDGELVLITCSSYSEETNTWNKRLVLTVRILTGGE